MLKNKGFLTIFYHFFTVLLYLYPILYTHMITKGQTMKKIYENLTIFFGIVFIMSMVGATGAVEADNYFVGFIMALVGISTGILTLIFQSKEDY